MRSRDQVTVLREPRNVAFAAAAAGGLLEPEADIERSVGSRAELGGPLPPVVEDIELGAVVRRFVGRLHDDADEVGPVPPREKGSITLSVAQVDPRLHPRGSAAAGQGLHVLEERSETFEP